MQNFKLIVQNNIKNIIFHYLLAFAMYALSVYILKIYTFKDKQYINHTYKYCYVFEICSKTIRKNLNTSPLCMHLFLKSIYPPLTLSE